MNKYPSGLRPCPDEHGRHHWIMHAAHQCVKGGMSLDDATACIASLLTRPPRHGEIEEALRKASGQRKAGVTHSAVVRSNSKRSSVAFDWATLARVAAKLPEASMEWLMAKSSLAPDKIGVCSYLQNIFYPEERVLIFTKYKSQGQLLWLNNGIPCLEMETLRVNQPEGVWFLCNPCDGNSHELERLRRPKNPSGRTRRAEENVTNFRHALIESDAAPPDLWLSALCQMPLPIVSIVTSGGRSLHALVRINATSKAQWDEVVRGKLQMPLTVLGADPGAMSAVRLTRLPYCWRYGKTDSDGIFQPFPEGPRLQRLLFLNPLADGTPIVDINPNQGGTFAS